MRKASNSNLLLRTIAFAFLVLSAASWQPANATTLNVPTQYATIQAAVTAAAAAGDTVLIANGTYTGVGNRDIDFGGKNLTVKSSGGSAACILDCQNAGRGFYFHNGETAASQVEGLTILHGNASLYGGGIYSTGGAGAAGPTAVNCAFVGNVVHSVSSDQGNGPIVHGNGGGMVGGSAVNCTFSGNTAGIFGGGLYRSTATNCVFNGNTASSGGGIFDGTATGCLFKGNNANLSQGLMGNVGGAGIGGGMYGGKAFNCIFDGNSANKGIFIGGNGGGMSGGTAIHCVFSKNSVISGFGSAAGGRISGGAATNCIFWGNTSLSAGPDAGSNAVVTYSIIKGGYAGAGNLDADPRFVNADAGDFHLRVDSPCVNAGTTAGVTLPATDYDGNPRIIGSAPDMGAYELPMSRLDLDRDGKNDLLLQNPKTGSVAFWLLNDSTLASSGVVWPGGDPKWKVVGASDIDLDGKPDVLLQYQADGAYPKGSVYVWKMDGTAIASSKLLWRCNDPNWNLVATLKIPGDSAPYVLFQHAITGTVHYWRLNPNFTIGKTGVVFQGDVGGCKVVGTPDLNGDGRPDILLQNPAGQVCYWLLKADLTVGASGLVYSGATDFKIVGAPDLDGNGHPDVLLQNPLTGAIHYWLLGGALGATILQSHALWSGSAPVLKVAAITDLTNSGRTSLIFQNAKTGSICYWNLDGLTIKGSGYLYSGSLLDWSIVAPR